MTVAEKILTEAGWTVFHNSRYLHQKSLSCSCSSNLGSHALPRCRCLYWVIGMHREGTTLLLKALTEWCKEVVLASPLGKLSKCCQTAFCCMLKCNVNNFSVPRGWLLFASYKCNVFHQWSWHCIFMAAVPVPSNIRHFQTYESRFGMMFKHLGI